jgi:acetyltransferase-like isoleucine patch superfamily enzyme
MPESVLPHDWFPRHVPPNVTIGAGSWLYSSFAFVHYRSQCTNGLRIGHDSGVYNGTFFDLGPEGEVAIGNYCTIVGAIFSTNGRVTIADYTFIAHEVLIADHGFARPYDEHDQHRPLTPATIRIGENVWIGARAIVLGNVQIGDGAIVGAAAVVDRDIPPYTIFAGNPARQTGLTL